MTLRSSINGGDLAGALEKVEKIAKQVSIVDDPRDVAGMASRWKSTLEQLG